MRWSGLPTDWRERTGSLGQVARAEAFVASDGAGRGTRRILAETGGGLAFEVLPDRAFDIGRTTFRGLPLAWLAPAGFPDGAAAGPGGIEWLRGFGGGLLATCGLDSMGPASADGGREHGLHGRIGRMPATVTRCEATEERITLGATVRQAALFGEMLRLDRTISAEVGGNTLRIEDRVTNEGVDPEGHMILYHCNFGWPLLDEGARVVGPGPAPVPRDPPAAAGLATWAEVHGPLDEYPEQVFTHAVEGPEGQARLENPRLGLAVAIAWDASTLPAMFQWKLLRRRHYVMGLEPVNTRAIFGRARARAEGELPILAPGETRTYRLALSVEDLP